MLILLTFLFSSSAHATDWLCTQEASQRRNNSILACGIGSASNEAQARSIAFENAKVEFTRVCDLSEDCRGHKINTTPSRTACETKGQYITCHRLVTFEIGELSGDALVAGSQNWNNAQIKKGMTKAQVTSLIGYPESAEPSSVDDGSYFYYKGKMCSSSNYCSIAFSAGGTVQNILSFKPFYDGIAMTN